MLLLKKAINELDSNFKNGKPEPISKEEVIESITSMKKRKAHEASGFNYETVYVTSEDECM